jgi:hypothetical protein
MREALCRERHDEEEGERERAVERKRTGGTVEMASTMRGGARSQARDAAISFFFFFLENYCGWK